MKKLTVVVILCLLSVLACNKKNSMPDTKLNPPSKNNGMMIFRDYAATGLDSPFVSIDTANVMIKSYLKSIESNSGDVKSLLVDADALRYYLGNEDIKFIKLMFAHRMRYVRGSGKDQYAGYQTNALTVVIAGYDDDNNYIYTADDQVMDFCRPCPYNCPEIGSASKDTLVK